MFFHSFLFYKTTYFSQLNDEITIKIASKVNNNRYYMLKHISNLGQCLQLIYITPS